MAALRRSTAFRFLSALAFASIILTTLLPGLAFGAPLVVISRPVNGAIVSGQIWIDVNFQADKNLPIVRLEVYIDDQLAREFDLAQPMPLGHQTFNWDFSYASNSIHKISARAIDSGNNAGVAAVSVTVQNMTATGPDVIAPVVNIYYPAQGAKVSGRTEIKAEAKDNVGVEMVVFYIDGKLHTVKMNAPPYVDSWDTTRDTDGLHVLEATAVDKAENEARSTQVTVVVENHSMTTMAPPSGGMEAQGVTPSPLPAEPTPQTVIPAPLPVAPDIADVVPAPVEPTAPVVQAPADVPSAPDVAAVPAGPSAPVAVGSSRQGGLAPAVKAGATFGRETVALDQPGSTSAAPGVTPRTATVPKIVAPSGQVATGPGAVTPQPPALAPATLAPATLAPVAPLLSLGTAASPRLSSSFEAMVPSAAPAARLTSPGAVKVEPIGPTSPTIASTPKSVQPVKAANLKPAANTGARGSGLARVTPVSAPEPERMAALTPIAAPLVVDVALAEYRGLPVPASRMMARLPGSEAAKLSADGRTTKPEGEIAAVPVAMRAVSDIKIVFDGEVLSLRATPETRDGISLAPLREIFQQTDGVLYWFPVEKQVHAVNKNVDMKLTIGDRKANVNGEERVLQVAPFIKQGRTMVPLQFIADVLDVNIAVDSATGQITISSNQL